ncbi:hypothetical protein K8R32_01520 [bacterium]|nr:hypothetical protein [bacterium]
MVEKGKVVVCQRCNAQLTNASDAELWEKEYLSKGIAKEKKVTCASCNYFTRLILITDRKFKDMDKINFFIRLRSAQSLIGYPSGPAGNAIFSVLVKKFPRPGEKRLIFYKTMTKN